MSEQKDQTEAACGGSDLTAELDARFQLGENMQTLGQIAYEAAAATNGCTQLWEDATQAKWEAAAQAVTEELAKICEAKANALGERADLCDDDEDAIELKARAWQMAVVAAELRARSNA